MIADPNRGRVSSDIQTRSDGAILFTIQYVRFKSDKSSYRRAGFIKVTGWWGKGEKTNACLVQNLLFFEESLH